MAVYNYRKFKVSLRHDSPKTQGLQTGDIVRRQYFDGTNIVYSLMCVLSNGQDELVDEKTNEIIHQPYFIGALLEGNVPKDGEILDFARVTNLFDQNRSGALYLTGSDDQSPYMDVIDGIGRNASLCWPENLATKDYQDSESQYIIGGADFLSADYLGDFDGNSRVLHVKCNIASNLEFFGLQQDFYKYVANPNRVLVSYKIKASKTLTCHLTLGYQDDTRIDGDILVDATTEWSYKFHAITIDYSGRYLRALKINMNTMSVNDELWVADLNIILLSSVSNYGDASKMRIGKLSGIVDPVFGTLDGYGGYMQKLFASGSAHVSGTLTAGDENGFAATFYAGKIHKNNFVNSIDIDCKSSVDISSTIDNPTGIGYVYKSNSQLTMVAQSKDWVSNNIDKIYTFSFWLFAYTSTQFSIVQNDRIVGIIQVLDQDTQNWIRRKCTFRIQSSGQDDLLLSVIPQYSSTKGEQKAFLFTSPQLESGSIVTQYQPTDDKLNYTDDYGAWFNRGGIGGTIQNPLLKLNADGAGSIEEKNKSFVLKADGSGHVAKGNIKWKESGDVTFGTGVKMTWDNLDDSTKEEIVSKSIKILGADTFTLLGDLTGAEPTTSPASIVLTLKEENFTSTSSQRKWYYLDGYDWIEFTGENGKTLTIFPFENYWGDSNNLTINCSVNYNGTTYTDTFTVKKQYLQGYTIEIVSENGNSFKNNSCETILTANVYYQGKLVDPIYAEQNYSFKWTKYHLPDLNSPEEGWDEGIDTTKRSITLDYVISGQDMFVCELVGTNSFPYEFPLIF